jgi:hypothetical protein
MGRILYVLLEHNFWAREQDVERGVSITLVSRPRFFSFPFFFFFFLFLFLLPDRPLSMSCVISGAFFAPGGCADQGAHRATERKSRIRPAHPRSLYVI